MKKNRKPTEEQKAAAAAKRSALCSMTAPFRPYVDANLEAVAAMMAGTSRAELVAYLTARGVPACFHFCTTLNACLQVVYAGQTGQTEWHSFQGWKEKGFSVNKGEKGFMIWSTPKKMNLKGEAENVETGETEQTEKTVHRFAIAYLFHAGQVSSEAGEKPASFNAAAPSVSAEEITATEASPAPATPEPAPVLALPESRPLSPSERGEKFMVPSWVQAPQRGGWEETAARDDQNRIIWARAGERAVYDDTADTMQPLPSIWDVEEPAPGQVLVLCPPPAEPAHIQEEFDLLAA